MGIIEEVQSKKDTAFYISFRITLETNCTDAKVCRDRLADAIRQHALWTMMFIDEMEPGEVEVCFCLNENQTSKTDYMGQVQRVHKRCEEESTQVSGVICNRRKEQERKRSFTRW